MFLLWLKLSATYILLPQQPNLNIIERKFKRQILKPDPIILAWTSSFSLLQDSSSVVLTALQRDASGHEAFPGGGPAAHMMDEKVKVPAPLTANYLTSSQFIN